MSECTAESWNDEVPEWYPDECPRCGNPHIAVLNSKNEEYGSVSCEIFDGETCCGYDTHECCGRLFKRHEGNWAVDPQL